MTSQPQQPWDKYIPAKITICEGSRDYLAGDSVRMMLDHCPMEYEEIGAFISSLDGLHARVRELEKLLDTALTETVPEKLIGLNIHGYNLLDFWDVWLRQAKHHIAELEAENKQLKLQRDKLDGQLAFIQSTHPHLGLSGEDTLS